MKNIFFLVLAVLTSGFSYAQNVQNIGGIGAQLILDTTGGHTMPRIFSLVPNSPAYQSLNATDYIIKVDDVSCRDKTIEQVVGLIRGEAGTKVKITTSGYKDGRKEKDTILTRVNMQMAAPSPPPDPAAAFYEACENEVAQMKKTGVEIIKTFNSECGDYFFNFNAETGVYHVRVTTMHEKTQGAGVPIFTATAKVYDSDNEAGALDLSGAVPADKGAFVTKQMDGSISFKHTSVGIISVSLHDDVKKCKGMYIIVYK